jgi:hypothetical protein
VKRVCSSCERPLRKGAARRAWVLSSHGELASGLVCARCALRALAFVVPTMPTVRPSCVHCKRQPAAVCNACHDRAVEYASELVKANVVLKQVGPQ